MAETVFEREARAVRQFQSDLGSYLRDGEGTLAERASAALQAYATRLEDAGVSSHAVTPARYALAVLIDHAARSERRCPDEYLGAIQRATREGMNSKRAAVDSGQEPGPPASTCRRPPGVEQALGRRGACSSVGGA